MNSTPVQLDDTDLPEGIEIRFDPRTRSLTAVLVASPCDPDPYAVTVKDEDPK